MKLTLVPCALSLIALTAAPLGGQSQPSPTAPPPIVTRGLDAYRTQGFSAAIDIWLEDSPALTDANKAQIIEGLKPMHVTYGQMIGADILAVVPIGGSVRRVYLVVRLERGPLYSFIDCYETAPGKWVIPGLMFNAQPHQILPLRFWGG